MLNSFTPPRHLKLVVDNDGAAHSFQRIQVGYTSDPFQALPSNKGAIFWHRLTEHFGIFIAATTDEDRFPSFVFVLTDEDGFPVGEPNYEHGIVEHHDVFPVPPLIFGVTASIDTEGLRVQIDPVGEYIKEPVVPRTVRIWKAPELVKEAIKDLFFSGADA